MIIGLKNLKRYFLTGIVTLLPLVITFWFLKWLFLKIDKFLFHPLLSSVQQYIKFSWLEFFSRIFIFFLIIMAISFLGFLINILFFRRLWATLENLISKFPFVGKVYNSIKQIIIAIAGQTRFFKKIVLVEYPHPGKYCLGFLTAEAEKLFNQAVGEELVSVFIPTTPNPTSGLLIYFPKNSIRVLDLTVEEGMRIVISAGTAVVRG